MSVPNSFLNTSWVSMQILRLLLNKLEVAEYFNRDWERDFNKEFAPGSSITVKFPERFLTTDGMGYNPQALTRISTTVSLDQWIQIGFEWDDYERAVKLERSEAELKENYWDPAAAAMSQEFDNRCANWGHQYTSQLAGVLGTDSTAVNNFYACRRLLKELACPPGKKALLVSSSQVQSLGQNITTIFHPADELDTLFKEGSIGKIAGFNVYESNSLYSHTAGSWSGASGFPKVSGAGQSGTSLIITANVGDTFVVGDKFSMANVNRLNPMTRRAPGPLAVKTFTITQALTAVGGAGGDTINFLPAIYGPGSPYQNVDALPINGAALTLFPGTASPNGLSGTAMLALSRYAFALVGTKLYVPKAVEMAGQAQDPDTGISVRKVVAWDGVRSVQINRMDSLMGLGNLYQDNGAVCLVGA